MHLMVGLRSAWKCVEVSLQDGCVPVIGGVALPECNIEPALWFKVLVLDCVCIDCSEHVISWAVASPAPVAAVDIVAPPSTISLPSTPHYSLMAPHDDGQPACPDDLHSLFQLAEALFQVSPLCSPNHAPPSSPQEEDWEQQSWVRLLHCLLLPLLTLHREDLGSLQAALNHHSSHTLTTLDTNIAHSSTVATELKHELEALRADLLPKVASWASHGACSAHFLSCFTSDLQEVEEEARSKIASSVQSLALQSRLRGPCSVSGAALSQQGLQAEKTDAQAKLMTALQLRAVLETQLHLQKSDPSLEGAPHSYSSGSPATPQLEGGQSDKSLQMEGYLELHSRLHKAREAGSQLARMKVLALSVREAMDQTAATLQAGRVATGMDTGLHGGHSTDVLQEASQYQAREEYTTLGERMKQLLHMSSSPASRLHHALFQAVEHEWFPAMCEGFVVISADMASKRSHSLSASQTRQKHRGWRRHFSLSSRAQPSPVRPVPATMSQAGQLLHIHFQEIVDALCEHFNDHDHDFQRQVWLCYEKLFFETFSAQFLSQYQTENLKLCEQLRLNALSVSVLPPHSLALQLPQAAWLHLFSPRSFEEAVTLFPQESLQYSGAAHKYLDVPSLPSELHTYFGSVTSDLYHMAGARAPLEKLQLLTSAFRKTMAILSDLKLSALLEKGDTDFHLAGVSCDDLLPVVVLLLLQLPPSFLSCLWLHCLLLEDCCPVFLQAGWHGYSLATFRSALTVITEL